jgi:hypothetical protein
MKRCLSLFALAIVALACKRTPSEPDAPASAASASATVAKAPIALPKAGDAPEVTVRAIVEAEHRNDKETVLSLYRKEDREVAETLDLVPDVAARPLKILATRFEGDAAFVDAMQGEEAITYPLAREDGVWKVDLAKLRALALESLGQYLADAGHGDAEIQKVLGAVEAGVFSKPKN